MTASARKAAGVKPGLRTTELAVTILTDVGIVASALAGVVPPKWAAVAAVVAQASYAISRGLAKQGAAGSGTVPG